MLSLLMTAEYLALEAAFGWELERAAHASAVVRFMTLTFDVLAYVVMLVFFARTLRLFVACPLSRLLSLFSLAFCTQLWGFSSTLNNHVPAACLIVIALYFALGIGAERLAPAPWRFLVFGLAGGLAATIDMPAGLLLVPAGLYLLAKFPRKALLWACLGAALPLGIHFAVMASVTGSLLPVQMRRELYLYEGSYWRHPLGVDALVEPKPLYLFHMTFGRRGVFSLYPVLLLGVVAAGRALFSKAAPMRLPVLAASAALVAFTGYYALFTNNYGGEAYGFRWYIVAMPVLLLMGATVLPGIRKGWQWAVVGLMIGVSFYSAWEASQTPWATNREWTCRIFGPSV